MISTKKILWIVLIAALSACGGGGGGGGGPTAPPPSGSLDIGFGNGGVITTDLGSADELATSLALQSDGKIVTGGYHTGAGSSDWNFALVRYHPNGSLDTSLRGSGSAKTDLGARDAIRALMVQPDNQIVAAGFTLNTTTNSSDVALARYNHLDGTLDNSFSANGTAKTDLNNGSDGALAGALQTDGKIVVAGTTDSNGTEDFAVLRYNSDGSLDATGFGSNGVVKTDFNGGDDAALAVAIDTNGKIVVAGVSDSHVALARYHPDGRLDLSFGANFTGKVTTPLGLSSQAAAIAIQPDGKILLAGGASYGGTRGSDIVVLRYLDNGTLDTNGFGFFGVAYRDLSDRDQANAIALQADGKILVAGEARPAGPDSFLVLRLNTDGAVDTGFGTSGNVLPAIPGATESGAYALAIQADGRILAAGGHSAGASGIDHVLVRLHP